MSTSIIQAQDLIVTFDNDSIDCRITEISDEVIFYTYDDYGITILSSIYLDDVDFYEYDFFEYYDDYEEQRFSRIRIAINGGWGYRTAKVHEDIPSDVVPYMKKLRSGYYLGTNITYYYSESYGAGIMFNYFNSKNEANNTSIGNLKDNISIYFAGPTFGSRTLKRNNNAWIFNIGIGYLGYHNNSKVNSQKKIFNGGTFGVAGDVCYDIEVSNNFAIGIQVSIISGTLTSLKIYDGYTTEKVKLEKDYYENLSHISLSVGFRFNAK